MNLNPFLLLERVREERALRCRPGTEQDLAWHAIVPNAARLMAEAKAAASLPIVSPTLPKPEVTEIEIVNPS
jgi:hypothetical protein